MGLLHVVVSEPGDVGPVGVADGDEVSLIFRGVAHELEVRRGPVAVLDGLALGPRQIARKNIQPAGSGDGQRAPEQCIDQAERGDAGADAKSERKNRGHRRDLVAPQLPPAEIYIGEQRFKPSHNPNAAGLARPQRGAECPLLAQPLHPRRCDPRPRGARHLQSVASTAPLVAAAHRLAMALTNSSWAF